MHQVFLAKRFGLVQKAGKLRVIDDCSIGGVNGLQFGIQWRNRSLSLASQPPLRGHRFGGRIPLNQPCGVAFGSASLQITLDCLFR